VMGPGEIYSLRMRLVAAGYTPIPCQDGQPVLTLYAVPSEGQIRSWATLHPDAMETGILEGGRVVLIDDVPKTPAEKLAQQIAERDARRTRAQNRQRVRNRQRKEANRRAEGALPRSEWLKAHAIGRARPWAAAGMSRSAWYRQQKRGTGSAGGG
jgi:hypothetical protein